ncbi:putative trna selenocysteine-associated protein 1 protein [Phaeoacremonium minimum UCRPA7]|uniref:Putative trna selenocysteine-associated protein 1 protein n=1 Tax=Phaeoacremonium minimum (strain UCR-PA7) TaxID=1286976 RepID=R8BY05_PHAM7|nr:putative trna selenocysteine-associated protein 1 protein [Phaeoacremonium minimum UCRPA7]EOO04238.1 putative trna selenocysteine-associated protein 1 protein [Phaeoacremonium minimum UCRPA7]
MSSFTGQPSNGGIPEGAPSLNGSSLEGNFPPPPAMAGGGEAAKTLWMGELEPWMDENFIKNVFSTVAGETVNVKVIRDRNSGNAGYCFVEFPTADAATKALALNGTPVPNSGRVFKLNWASGGGLVDRRDDRGPEFSIFVGDLGPEVNEFVLVSLFQARFPSCKSAKIMTDAVTGQSRGYGFVRFAEEGDQQRALVEMQGVYCGNRPMRISTATPKTRSHQYGQGNHGGPGMMQQPPMQQGGMNWGMQPYYQQNFNPMQPMNQFTDPNNTTVFVGGLSGYVTEDELRSFFQGFGEITYVKIPPGKGCGFVQFVHRHAAEMAINQMQGYPIGNSRVRLSWGRSQNNSGVGTPYRPAPPPPHYMGGGMPPHGGPGPYGPHHFGGNPPQGPPPGGMQQ